MSASAPHVSGEGRTLPIMSYPRFPIDPNNPDHIALVEAAGRETNLVISVGDDGYTWVEIRG